MPLWGARDLTMIPFMVVVRSGFFLLVVMLFFRNLWARCDNVLSVGHLFSKWRLIEIENLSVYIISRSPQCHFLLLGVYNVNKISIYAVKSRKFPINKRYADNLGDDVGLQFIELTTIPVVWESSAYHPLHPSRGKTTLMSTKNLMINMINMHISLVGCL